MTEGKEVNAGGHEATLRSSFPFFLPCVAESEAVELIWICIARFTVVEGKEIRLDECSFRNLRAIGERVVDNRHSLERG